MLFSSSRFNKGCGEHAMQHMGSNMATMLILLIMSILFACPSVANDYIDDVIYLPSVVEIDWEDPNLNREFSTIDNYDILYFYGTEPVIINYYPESVKVSFRSDDSII